MAQQTQTGAGSGRRQKLQGMLQQVSQQMYLRNRELAETNKMLSLLQAVDAIALESDVSLEMVCQRIATAIVQSADYPFVGLLTRAGRGDELVLGGWDASRLLGVQPLSGLARPLHVHLGHQWFDMPDTTISIDLAKAGNHATPLGEIVSELRKESDKTSIKSLYAVKLLSRRRLVGLLVVGFLTPASQQAATDTKLINRLSESVGVALDNKLLFEENQRVLLQLRESNAKLRALDEAKDDFISMASHQLRTPLTSVKGYLSMIIEGDAGKTTAQQKKMLGQAFFSSQRMVYLIADLLNVSRLKTGKFVIERAPVNLATVVKQELAQLDETASARQLTLTYAEPKKFPELMLDETKTRQVIMNFVDNAIYYTPAGGHIMVRLIDNPTTVELRVEDDGIGVAKHEQPHLFTKFYRAGNARKARPDGTGLGLFMAKKVVLAQGGSIIFESQEDKGSTFGFVFSKSKLAAPAPVTTVLATEKPATKDKHKKKLTK